MDQDSQSTPRASSSSLSSSSSSKKTPPPPPTPQLSLVEPANSTKKKNRTRVFRVFRNVFRSFPIITPACKLPSLPGGRLPDSNSRIIPGSRITGTLFGYRKGRVSISIQENPRTLPTVVIELALQTNVLQKEMNLGMVRIALECEKRDKKEKINLLEEPLWSMYCNGKKSGYGVKREATEEDLNVMEILKPVSMGAGVLPGKSDVEGPDGEMTYMRAHFERVVKSKDAETLYMLSPDANDGPELSIFFVRI
ncbi:protein MIZU-KUSSEI 1-like [Nicotiana tomentosiformis]|uniref:protein MIZU-KUSSEI 1-like n=1 Tax=Nicotiana tomentosiformis TaxID=4098 RepID=UPI00051BBF58|nr:protein MIZU-KUSSEI 1-like [Nicotiana tomentosiformis]